MWLTPWHLGREVNSRSFRNACLILQLIIWIETRWNTMKQDETRWNQMKPDETRWNTMKHAGTVWRSIIGRLMFKGQFPQKSPIIIGSCAEKDLQLKIGLGISRTSADSQWILVYNAFHRFFSNFQFLPGQNTFFFRNRHCAEVLFSREPRDYPNKCTDLELSFLFILMLGAYRKFARKNIFSGPRRILFGTPRPSRPHLMK